MSRVLARFAVIDCEDDERWRGLASCVVALFGADDERWDHYRAYDRELPELETLQADYDGVVITGSSHSIAMKGQLWVEELERWTRDAFALARSSSVTECDDVRVTTRKTRKIKFLAMGFGSYVCARALEGEVGMNPRSEHVVGGTTLETTASFRASESFTRAIATYGAPTSDSAGEKLFVHENRTHDVLKAPKNCEVYARSASSACEIWTDDAQTVLAWQHSFSDGVASVLSHKVESGLDAKRSTSVRGKASENKVKDDLPDNDAGFLIGVARCFLRGGREMANEDALTLKERRRNARECLSWASKRREEILHSRALARSGSTSTTASADARAESYAERALTKISAALNAEINLVTNEVRFLEHANDMASATYVEIGQKIEALDVFVDALRQKGQALEPRLASIAGVEHQIRDMEHTVRAIDKHVTSLENRFKALKRTA